MIRIRSSFFCRRIDRLISIQIYQFFLKNPDTNKIPAVTSNIPKRNSFNTISHRSNATTPKIMW